MKNRPLVRIYDLPKSLLLQDMARYGCMHNGTINFQDNCCCHCELAYECLSMLKVIQNEKNKPLSSMSGETLINFLRSSTRYIKYKIHMQHHVVNDCNCELCQWLKEADELLRELQN